jgi:hypothetical protein
MTVEMVVLHIGGMEWSANTNASSASCVGSALEGHLYPDPTPSIGTPHR